MKNVLLTGASGGIGAEIEKIFTNKGYKVICLSIEDIDLSNRTNIDSYFKKNKTDFDIVIHCAGINNLKVFEDIEYKDIDKTLEVNLLSFYRILHWVLPSMRRRKEGRILGMSSIYSIVSRAKRLPYAISKHGMQALVKTLSQELGPDNVLINSISPGFVDTELTRKNLSSQEIKKLQSRIPLKRLATPEEIAKTALFLCSEDNTYITGQNIIVDGGFIVGMSTE